MNQREAGCGVHGRKSPDTCSHGRLVNDQRRPDGQKTGTLICKECGAILQVEKGTRLVSAFSSPSPLGGNTSAVSSHESSTIRHLHQYELR